MESKPFASLCLLAYKRPESLVTCLSSLWQKTVFPHEIIINLDADDDERNRDFLYRAFRAGKLSKLIFTNGSNRGVGRSFANCVGVAEGDYIVKIDTDLTFLNSGWLKKAVKILEDNEDIGAVSLFNYRNYDPIDDRFNKIEERDDCFIVDDFVSSIYIFRRKDLSLGGWEEDDGFHTRLGKLAITKTDFVRNSGFGVEKSTYVTGTDENPRKTKTYNKPLIFNDPTDKKRG